MKKILVALIAFLYITATTGATVHLHYCMGKKADWNLIKTNSKTCNKCGMKKTANEDNGCCKDELKFIKDNSAQKITESGFNITESFIVTLPPSFIEIAHGNYQLITNSFFTSHSPPIINSVAVYILHCTYLI